MACRRIFRIVRNFSESNDSYNINNNRIISLDSRKRQKRDTLKTDCRDTLLKSNA